MTREHVLKLLEARCNGAGSQSAFASKHHISAAYVNDVLQKKRAPGRTILDALGLYAETVYRRKSEQGR